MIKSGDDAHPENCLDYVREKVEYRVEALTYDTKRGRKISQNL